LVVAVKNAQRRNIGAEPAPASFAGMPIVESIKLNWTRVMIIVAPVNGNLKQRYNTGAIQI
jgi:hypothetical protein